MRLSTDERRALGILAALLLLAGAARWLERPRSILENAADLDLATLEDESRSAHNSRSAKPKRTAPAGAAGARPSGRRGSAGPAAEEIAPRITPAERVDPNRASAEELTRLPGVSPGLAALIVAERERAPFRSLQDLARIRGVGPALVTRLAEHLTLAPVPRPAPAPPAGARAPPATTSPGTSSARPPLDLNAATAEELVRISGVGPAMARRLVTRRDSLGRFRSYDDVDAVPGVGPALLAKLRAATFLR